MSNTDLAEAAHRIQKQLSNPEFSGIQPTPEQVRFVLNKFISQNNLCAERNYSHIASRNKLRQDLLHLLRLQLFGVNNIAASQPNLLAKSGFKLRKERSAPALPAQVKIKSIKPGIESGCIIVKLATQRNVKYYELAVLEQSGRSKIFTSTNTTVHAYGLKDGSLIKLAARAYSSAGSGPYSLTYTYFVPVTNESFNNPTIRIIQPDESAS